MIDYKKEYEENEKKLKELEKQVNEFKKKDEEKDKKLKELETKILEIFI